MEEHAVKARHEANVSMTSYTPDGTVQGRALSKVKIHKVRQT